MQGAKDIVINGNDILSTTTCRTDQVRRLAYGVWVLVLSAKRKCFQFLQLPQGKITIQTSVFPTKTGHTVSIVTVPTSKLAGGLKIIVEHTITTVDESTSTIATSYEIGWVNGRPTLYKKIQNKVRQSACFHRVYVLDRVCMCSPIDLQCVCSTKCTRVGRVHSGGVCVLDSILLQADEQTKIGLKNTYAWLKGLQTVEEVKV